MNNVILDVVIGIIFIFLLYSLLATSIQEAIATAFSMRARMLRNGIIIGMLSNTANDSRWTSIIKGIVCFFQNIWKLRAGKKPAATMNLGQLFYNHPLVKNYGSSRIFPNPSYLPSTNFSTVLIDILLADFDQKIAVIARANAKDDANSIPEIQTALSAFSDQQKIQELLNFYRRIYSRQLAAGNANLAIEMDTWQILQLHLKNSFGNMEMFALKLQTWFDDSMDRISGWYKRQVQLILFIIGFVIAILFNVDIILISGKLSTDKDARDQLVNLAKSQAEGLKDDPRVKAMSADSLKGNKNQKGDSLLNSYNKHFIEAKQMIESGLAPANQLLALGWADFGKKKDSAALLQKYVARNEICNDLFLAKRPACMIRNSSRLDSVFSKHEHWLKFSYVTAQIFDLKKLAGLLLTAFAISLGAPFWFDLLNKFMNIRACGKKEERSTSSTSGSAANQPVVVNVNNSPSEEIAG